MLQTLFFAVLWGSAWTEGWLNRWGHKESQAEETEFRLQVEKEVTVQLGQCVLVPCSFSYPQGGHSGSTPAYGYWFKDRTEVTKGFPVATNDQSRKVQEWNRGRFQLLGNPWDLSCSLLITDAWMTDKGWYFFRVEAGTSKQYSFMKNKLYLNVIGMELAGMGWDLPLALPVFPAGRGCGAWVRGSPSEVPHLGLQSCLLSS